jgi:4-alpha-glucanotransferase
MNLLFFQGVLLMIDEMLRDKGQPSDALTEALRLLDKPELLLAVHDASFPGAEGEDTGRGSPYSAGGLSFARFARSLGFTGLQMGPQGQISPANLSPYDGTLFSRSILSLDLKDLVDQGLFSMRQWETMVAGNPCPDGRRVPSSYVFEAYQRALMEIHSSFRMARDNQDAAGLMLDQELRELRQSARWLRDDGLYEVLVLEHGSLPWRQWPQEGEGALDRMLCAPVTGKEAACAVRRQVLETRHACHLERYALGQLILLKQHQAFQGRMRDLGLKIYGDVQVGLSLCDAWARQALLLPRYFMGAPPSRTNVEGQPWSYPVLDPGLYLEDGGAPGPALRFMVERLGKMLAEFDGLRLDHPHGLICPWVYQADDSDPYHAVQNGARLFSSPDLPDHPGLARHAIVGSGQINRQRPRYADDWVRELTPAQEDRYALIMDALMDQVQAHGRRKSDILCEVLSTEPLPLQRVRLRHGLGRFRVTQKANLDDPGDVYRGENAQPQDWVMVGNHDTPPIWQLVKTWQVSGEGEKQAAYLAHRLCPDNPELLASSLAADPCRLAHAKLADLFLSPARHVMIFFADLLGLEDIYNMPGVHNKTNWTLRVVPDFIHSYDQNRHTGRALNLHAAVALALRARADINRPDLAARLEAEAGWRINA